MADVDGSLRSFGRVEASGGTDDATQAPVARFESSGGADDATRRGLGVPSGGGLGDITPPVITAISPSLGSPLQPSTPLVVRSTDETGLAVHRLFATFAGVPYSEVVYDGTNFVQPYAQFSTVTEIVPGKEYEFTVQRTGGWIGAVALNALAVDTSGNLST